MIKPSELPREPNDAFQYVLSSTQKMSHSFPNGSLNSNIKTNATANVRMLQHISKRLENPEDYHQPLIGVLEGINSAKASVTQKRLDEIEGLFLANTLHDHFIDEEEEREFNTLAWQAGDKHTVLDALSMARKLIVHSEDFDGDHKRRLIYWVGKAENEVFKEKGKLGTVLSAASQIADIACEFGEKGKPLAKLIETVRTTTKKNVTEVRQIPKAQEPKKLAAPSDD